MIASLLKSATDFSLNLIFPPLCLACKNRLKTNQEKSLFLCQNCSQKITVNSGFFCSECGRRIPFENSLSQNDPRVHPRFNTRSACCSALLLAAASSYNNKTTRELIHTLKYQEIKTAMIPIKEFIIKPYIENVFGNCLPRGEALRGLPAIALAKAGELSPFGRSPAGREIGNFVVVPVPLHKSKERKRGFNQTQLIAENLISLIEPISPTCPAKSRSSYGACPAESRRDLCGVDPILIRAKKTKSQAELKDKEARELNIQDCFAINQSSKFKIQGSTTIVVDDVFTSGATMKEATRVLKEAGAKKIIGFVLAKA